MNTFLLLGVGAAFAAWVGMAIDNSRTFNNLSRGLRIAALGSRGLVLGVCAWQAVVVAVALVAPSLSVGPVMVAFGAVSVLGSVRFERRGGATCRASLGDRVAAVVVVGTVAALSEALVSNVSTPDSFHYSSLAGLVGQGQLDLATWDTITRSFGISAVHAASVLTDQLYFDGFSPLISVATTAMLFVGVVESAATHQRFRTHWSLIAGALVVALLWMPYIWRISSSYLNSHALVAAVTLLIVIKMRERVAELRFSPLQRWSGCDLLALSLLLGSLAMTRAEGPFFAALSGAVVLWIGFDVILLEPLGRRLVTVASLFGVAFLWQLLLLVGADAFWGSGFSGLLSETRAEERADFLPVTVLPFLLYGAVVALGALIPLLEPLGRLRMYRIVPVTALVAVLLANVGAVVISQERGWDSLKSTYLNVPGGAGGWGVAGATVLCAASTFALLRGWRFWNELTLLAYLPLLVVPLGVLRGSAYEGGEIGFRVGVTDSMNRILLHFYPLALFTGALFVLAALSSRDEDGHEATPGANTPNFQSRR